MDKNLDAAFVLIDPGHGGDDTGAISHAGEEKRFNLIVASMLQEALSRLGVSCGMTRGSDVFVSLDDRVLLEHSVKPSCFVSLHCNNWRDDGPRGFEIFTSPGETGSDSLATSMHSEIAQIIPGMPWRSDLSDGDSDKEERFRVLTGTKGPAVLMEMAFLSNPQDLAFITAQHNQYRLAHAMTAGIVKWLL